MSGLTSFRAKSLSTLLLVGLAAVSLTTWEASRSATAALRKATDERLTAVLNSRVSQLERYFLDVGNHVIALASDETAIEALEQFSRSWPAIPGRPDATDVLANFYRQNFAKLSQNAASWIPREPQARRLQQVLIVDNPYPAGSRSHRIDAPGTGPYDSIHRRFHPTFQRYRAAFGFYDLFLIDSGGRVLYTARKETDIGVAVAAEPYVRTGLSRVWRRALELSELETYVVEDYSPYFPSSLAPASFVAAPVHRAGSKVGVLAVQLSIDEVNRVMTAGQRWQEDGLGQTGQAYLIAADGALRSDLRQEIEDPQGFIRSLENAGVAQDVIARIRSDRTAVLNLTIPLAGELDLQKQPVMRVRSPVSLPELQWAVVAEIQQAEALAPISALQRRLLSGGLVVTLALSLVALFLSRMVTRPVVALADAVRRLGEHDFSARVPVTSSGEIGELASAFNRMAGELERTTVSKEELDRMLNSLIDAVFIVEIPRDASWEQMMEAPVTRANEAALKLAASRNVTNLQLRDLLPEDPGLLKNRLSPLLKEGHLPAIETTIRSADGTTYPVLLAASWLHPSLGRRTGIAVVAQDITGWKRTQAELEKLTERLISAQEEERIRLARELHDDLTQRLAAVAIDLGRIHNAASASDPILERAKRELAGLSEDVHGLSRRLHPSILVDLGLVAAVESECRAFFDRGGAPVELVLDDAIELLPPETQLGLYRIVQEGLQNIAKHAEATEVRIHARRDGEEIIMQISDNGRGFDPSCHAGLGLSSIVERTRIFGGTFELTSSHGEGTSLLVRAPYGGECQKLQS